jgi:hypothetical protein
MQPSTTRVSMAMTVTVFFMGVCCLGTSAPSDAIRLLTPAERQCSAAAAATHYLFVLGNLHCGYLLIPGKPYAAAAVRYSASLGEPFTACP